LAEEAHHIEPICRQNVESRRTASISAQEGARHRCNSDPSEAASTLPSGENSPWPYWDALPFRRISSSCVARSQIVMAASGPLPPVINWLPSAETFTELQGIDRS